MLHAFLNRLILRSGARSLRAAVVLVLFVLFALSAAVTGRAAEVTDVRIGDHGAFTRFVLDVSGNGSFQVFALDQPARMVIDLPGHAWTAETLPARPAGVVRAYRHGRFKPDVMRVVLDLGRPALARDVFYLSPRDGRPARIVIDLEPVPHDRFAAQLDQRWDGMTGDTAPADGQATAASRGAPLALASAVAAAVPVPAPAAPARATAPAPARAGLVLPPRKPPPPTSFAERLVIAIDPGHGGIDPGAIGAGGSFEKDIVLATAQKLKAILEQNPRYRVVMTRERDTFLRLRERVGIARAANADIFLSLHADSLPQAYVRGASIYTLSETASDAEAALLAQRENAADLIAGVAYDPADAVTNSILIDLAQRLSQNESRVLADRLVDSLGQAGKVLAKPRREAGFVVLKAHDVPSVLVELGFLSNTEDERLLNTAEYQRTLARAMAEAIDAYFAWQHAVHRS